MLNMATTHPLSENATIEADADPRWQAVLARDRSQDGRFVYAVRTTGVYCRPSCPSRRPRRHVVTFFDAPAGAIQAGYRACKRCKPDIRAGADPWIDKIRRACVYLANVDGHPSLARLARHLGGSPYHVQRNFKRIVGVTPREYADACRLGKVKQRLRRGEAVTDAMLDAGYGSSSRFYERAAAKLGMTPSTYKQGAAGQRISYAVADSPLGKVLVAATAKGVCAVSMGDSEAALVRSLAGEYPSATLSDDDRELKRWTHEIIARVRGQQPRIDLPLDVRATAFQWQVWNALAGIPHGETRSYRDVAKAIGRPRAVRAVARACATNPAAIAIPCHRVVPSAGGTGGYRWGSKRKEALLRFERSKGRA